MTVPDALIMAYADGELDGPLATRIRDAIESNRTVRDKFEIYVGSRRLLASVFESVLSERVPDRLKQTVAPPKSPRATKPNVKTRRHARTRG